jgi:hypothetical protein
MGLPASSFTTTHSLWVLLSIRVASHSEGNRDLGGMMRQCLWILLTDVMRFAGAVALAPTQAPDGPSNYLSP